MLNRALPCLPSLPSDVVLKSVLIHLLSRLAYQTITPVIMSIEANSHTWSCRYCSDPPFTLSALEDAAVLSQLLTTSI